jgi:mono/diheme cytochrome c family protein
MTVSSRLRSSRPSRARQALGFAGAIMAIVIWLASARPAPAAASQAAQAPPSTAALVAQGDYLTHRVAMCVQCHSPRDVHGELLMSEQFRGGAIPVQSPYPNKMFAYRAPNISGLPGFTDDQIIALLTEGRATDRDPPRPPMPPFRMSRQDAQAVVAYLRSLQGR